MEDKMKTYFGLLKLIKIAVFFLILFFLIFYPAYSTVKQDQNMVQHHIIMETLKKYVDSGGQIPRNLSELALLEYSQEYIDGSRGKESLSSLISFQKKKYDLRYYPESWNKPGRILLQSSISGSYIVTFGDGCQAVLYRWYNRESEGRPTRLFATTNLCVMLLFSIPIIILIMIIIVEYFLKRAKKPERTE